MTTSRAPAALPYERLRQACETLGCPEFWMHCRSTEAYHDIVGMNSALCLLTVAVKGGMPLGQAFALWLRFGKKPYTMYKSPYVVKAVEDFHVIRAQAGLEYRELNPLEFASLMKYHFDKLRGNFPGRAVENRKPPGPPPPPWKPPGRPIEEAIARAKR